MVLFQLFSSFLRIGLFAIGGAYSFLPLIEKEVVGKYSWLTKEEFLEVLGMVKLFPGAISIKYATYTGYKVAGIWGIIAANVGNFLAPVLIVLFIAKFYMKYRSLPQLENAFNTIQLVVFSMIIAVAFQTIKIDQLMHLKSIIIVLVAFVLFVYSKIHPAFIILGAGLLGIFI
ncbi:MAG: chromate transporter [Candidatus Omnitrophica bacterium]|nr:chromate transporter [Candidatus Omnitrophota bacterium]MBU1997069.1 chromate transporter [Candidatus Omnitrophota bacterium]MBU4333973.1 chromate transporter [Candidatus Omnitrophota bacterium]